MISTELNYIIAIGASAGGMEEINSFFDHTPLDKVSYVIIQHLSADFKSRMVELLARHSKLEVVEAKNGTIVKSNMVYLIPNDKYMIIKDGRLLLTKKTGIKGPHLTIDKFFISLAADHGDKAIGVILSGLGSDGTEGIKAIKKANGMVMVRNSGTSEFSSMPAHAIATGIVDYVLEPELMPLAIENYVKNEEGALTGNNDDDDKIIIEIIDLINQQTPLDFSDYKSNTILRRTKRRAQNGNFASLKAYFEYLKETPQELNELSKEFLISVTSFFRDPEAFEFLNANIIPGLLEKLSPGEELKIWVAGCATGEEVYSLAILVAENLDHRFKDTIVKIFATDIDEAAMEHAGKGIYPPGIAKNIPAGLLNKYFLKENNHYKVRSIIRKMVIFAHHDLVKNPPYCNMHLISCRNLLIYLTPALQKKIFAMLLFGLKMDGYLFLGSSESPMPIMANLQVVNKKWKIYKNIKAKRTVSFDAFSMPELNMKHKPASLLRDEPLKNISNSTCDEMHMELAREFNYLIVCIDENNQVVKSYGDTGKYLFQQNFNAHLPELLPDQLAIAFNTLVSDTRKTNKRTNVAGIIVDHGTSVMKVDLSVIPLLSKKGSQNIVMVMFTSKDTDTPKHKKPLFDEKIYMDKYTKNLEEELKDLKDTLHITYEQLDASNENLQSFNEELISANEEMQSTNEEMQSVNEELHTINADYQLKNKELVEMNDDLNNYFRSNVNGQLFINNELLLMKFSPGAVKQINLVETDIGRPLHHISTNIKFETIIHDVKQVLVDGSLISKEIETNNGKWYQMMIMPYLKQAESKVNGVIITFNDVTALKQTQTELDKKNQSLVKINADLDHFVYAASHDLLAPLGNIESSIDLINHIALPDEKLVDFLNIIHKSVKTFRSLIVDIADIAKVEADMIKMEWVNMDDLVNNIEWSLEDKIKISGATIIRNLDVKEIMFSKKNLRSIIFNLVSNAIKFKREEDPIINILTLMQEDHILLSVQDNGRGVAEKDLAGIFDIYGRFHQDIEGSGIGLYLAKKIINAAGGSIEVQSEVGKGSIFIIRFKKVS